MMHLQLNFRNCNSFYSGFVGIIWSAEGDYETL